jgi:hypothetical protein
MLVRNCFVGCTRKGGFGWVNDDGISRDGLLDEPTVVLVSILPGIISFSLNKIKESLWLGVNYTVKYVYAPCLHGTGIHIVRMHSVIVATTVRIRLISYYYVIYITYNS